MAGTGGGRVGAVLRLALRPRRPGGFALSVAALAALAAAHALVRTSAWGAGIEIDSHLYLGVAENILGGEGVTTASGGKFLHWPPGYPLLLAGFGLLGADMAEAARWANAAAFGLTVLASGLWLGRRLRSRALALAAAAALASSVPLTTSASRVMTEAPFVLCTLLALMLLESRLRRRTDRRALALAAALLAAAALLRYAGVVAAGAGVLLLLAARGAAPFPARLREAAAFGVAAALPLAIYGARNLAISGTLSGDFRALTSEDISAPLAVAAALGRWALPEHAPDWSAPLPWAALAIAALAGARAVASSTRGGAARAAGWGAAAPFAVYALAYLVFLVLVTPQFTAGGIPHNVRYLTPIYAPLLLAGAVALDRLLASRGGGRLAFALLAAALLHAAVSAYAGVERTREVLASGYPPQAFNTPLRESPTLAWAKANGVLGGPTWSTHPALPRLAEPAAAPGRHRELPRELSALIGLIGRVEEGEDAAHVVWVDLTRYGWDPFFRYREFDVATLPGVETLASFGDGAVFRAPRGLPHDARAWAARREAAVRSLVAPLGAPATGGAFEVYADPGARALTYVRVPCAPTDAAPRFFVHVHLADKDDLPAERRASGFVNLDFDLRRAGTAHGGSCLATVALPEAPIARVRTGQWDGGDELWSVDVAFGGR